MTATATRPALTPTRPALPAAAIPAPARPARFLGYTRGDWAKILFCWFVAGPAGGILLGVVLVVAFKEGTPSPAEPMPAGTGGGPVPAMATPAAPSVERPPSVTRVPPRRTTTRPPPTGGAPVAAPPVTHTVTVTPPTTTATNTAEGPTTEPETPAPGDDKPTVDPPPVDEPTVQP